MLLVDQARSTFVDKAVGGGDFAVELLDVRDPASLPSQAFIPTNLPSLLQRTTSPERIFLASRILFLSTVSMHAAGALIKSIVEAKYPSITDVIGSKLDMLSRAILSGTKFAREAMTDLLKFTFNLLLHYPRVRPAPSPKSIAADVRLACRRI